MTGKCYRTMQKRTVSETTGMLGVNPHNRGTAERLDRCNSNAGQKRPIKSAKCFQNTSKRCIPRKPSLAQIERFEALRARVMGISKRW